MRGVVIFEIQLVVEGSNFHRFAQVARLKARLEYECLVDGQRVWSVRRQALGRDRRGRLRRLGRDAFVKAEHATLALCLCGSGLSTLTLTLIDTIVRL